MKTFVLRSLPILGLAAGFVGCATKPQPASPPSGRAIPQVSSSEPIRSPDTVVTNDAIKEPVGILSLPEALALALFKNPELEPFAWQQRADEARILQAGLRANPALGLEVEDVLGTGVYRGGRQAQTTLQLSQVIELGGKRAARQAVAELARGISKSEYELKRVEVLGAVTHRFIEVVSGQHALDLAVTNRQLASETIRAVQERAKAGKASIVDERKAEVALSRSEIVVEGAKHELNAARKKLAASWRSSQPTFTSAAADFFAAKPLPRFEEFSKRISNSPEIARWISEQKLREAEIRLADAQRFPNISVGGGIRRFEGPGDEAFIFGFSMPLPIFDRNQGGAAEARALFGKSEAQRKAAETRISTVILGLYEEITHDVHIMEGLQTEVLPKAEEALAGSLEGFKQGRFSYLEVLDAQRTIFDVKREYIQAATSYHQLLVEIERLLGEPIEIGNP